MSSCLSEILVSSRSLVIERRTVRRPNGEVTSVSYVCSAPGVDGGTRTVRVTKDPPSAEVEPRPLHRLDEWGGDDDLPAVDADELRDVLAILGDLLKRSPTPLPS